MFQNKSQIELININLLDEESRWFPFGPNRKQPNYFYARPFVDKRLLVCCLESWTLLYESIPHSEAWHPFYSFQMNDYRNLTTPALTWVRSGLAHPSHTLVRSIRSQRMAEHWKSLRGHQKQPSEDKTASLCPIQLDLSCHLKALKVQKTQQGLRSALSPGSALFPNPSPTP